MSAFTDQPLAEQHRILTEELAEASEEYWTATYECEACQRRLSEFLAKHPEYKESPKE